MLRQYRARVAAEKAKHEGEPGHTMMSHGRGGAGNINSSSTESTQPDLFTPTIKGEVYTTGRGGTGNMARNDPEHPEYARESQDLTVPRTPRSATESEFHYGRGGAANVGKPSANDIIQAKIENAKWDLTGRGEAPIDHEKLDYRGWADKGRDMIFGRKKK